MTYFPLALLSLIFTVLAYILTLTGILALFLQDNNKLPWWLSWFDTPDNLTIGDELYRNNQMKGVTNRWWIATCWLARNPAYGFDHVVGAKVPEGFTYSSKGDELTTNAPIHNGWVFRQIDNAWQFYAVYQWSDTKCWKLNFGWKLWGRLEAGQVRQLVCTITPFAKVA